MQQILDSQVCQPRVRPFESHVWHCRCTETGLCNVAKACEAASWAKMDSFEQSSGEDLLQSLLDPSWSPASTETSQILTIDRMFAFTARWDDMETSSTAVKSLACQAARNNTVVKIENAYPGSELQVTALNPLAWVIGHVHKSSRSLVDKWATLEIAAAKRVSCVEAILLAGWTFVQLSSVIERVEEAPAEVWSQSGAHW